MRLLPLAILLLACDAKASSATQSNWSGGPGVPGPVSTWDNGFWLAAGTSWSEAPGSVGIATTMLEHLVDNYTHAIGVEVADINGDGFADVIASSSAEPITWWENTDGSGSNWIGHTITGLITYVTAVKAEDIDGDGDLDIVGAVNGMSDILWWENADGQGTSWMPHEIDTSFLEVWSVLCDDLDGDGDTDVLAAAIWDSSIRWWENSDGQGTSWIEHSIVEAFDGAVSIHSGDVDGDGDPDIIGVACYADEVAWWENLDGQGMNWAMHMIDAEYDAAWPVDACDVDGDGDIDVLGSSFNTQVITWWENADGLGNIWIEHTIDTSYRARSICSIDIDGDGDIDVLAGGDSGYHMTWWENVDGLGTVWSEHVIDAVHDDNQSVLLADINGDSHVDAAGAYYGPSIVSWWDLNAYSPEASLESSILYTGCDPDWGTLLWSSQTPPGTSVSFQVRASDDFTQMGAWSDTLTAPCSLQGLLPNNTSYVQYRAIFSTANPDTTPTLLDVTITWDPLGTGYGDTPPAFGMLSVSPNPVTDALRISFAMPEPSLVEFTVFGISGRIVREAGPMEYQPGVSSSQLGEFHPGIYFVRMTAGEFMATQRFVVVE